MEKTYFIFKMTGAAMVWLASSDFWKAPLMHFPAMVWLASSDFWKAPLMHFPEVRAGLFKEFRQKKPHQSCVYYSGIDQSGWIVLIKSEILIMRGMVWLACFNKWKALLDSLESSRC